MTNRLTHNQIELIIALTVNKGRIWTTWQSYQMTK